MESQKKMLSVLLAGAGAIGGIVAAYVARAGYHITVLARGEESARIIRERGLEISGIKGKFLRQVPAVASGKELKGKWDVVLLAVKAYDAIPLLHDLAGNLHPGSLVVSLQNGIVEDAIAAVVGEERTIGCVVGWGATMHGPGRLEMTSTGEFVIGRLDGQKDDKLLLIRDILSSVLPVEISENIRGQLYSKLIINSCITSLGALTGMYLGKMLARSRSRQLFIAIMKEAIEVAEAMNLKVETYAGKLDFYKFFSWKGCIGDFRRHALIWVIGLKYRRLKSSSLQSLERGKPTEIDYLNGYIVDRARELGLQVPVNERLVRLIKEIEEGKRQISPENIEELKNTELIT